MTAKFQMDGAGNIRVGFGDHFGEPADYVSIAFIEHEGRKYMAVSEYYAGFLNAEKVYELVEVPTEGEELPDQNFFDREVEEKGPHSG